MKAYLAGDVQPSVKALGNISIESGFSLDWILTGRGEKRCSPNKPPNPKTNPLDFGVAEVLGENTVHQQLRRLRDVYQSIGTPLIGVDAEDEVIGGTLDVILENARLPREHQLTVASIAVEIHSIAARYIARQLKKVR